VFSCVSRIDGQKVTGSRHAGGNALLVAAEAAEVTRLRIDEASTFVLAPIRRALDQPTTEELLPATTSTTLSGINSLLALQRDLNPVLKLNCSLCLPRRVRRHHNASDSQ